MSYNQGYFMDDYKEKNSYSNYNSHNEKDGKYSQKGICYVNTVCFYPVDWDCKEKEDDKKPCRDDNKRNDKDEKRPCCKCRFESREENCDSHDDKDDYKNNDFKNDKQDCQEDNYRDNQKGYQEDKRVSYDDKKDCREEKQECRNNNQRCCRCNRCCNFGCRNWLW